MDTNINEVKDCWTYAIQKMQLTFPGPSLRLSMEANYSDNWAKFIKTNEGRNSLPTNQVLIKD